MIAAMRKAPPRWIRLGIPGYDSAATAGDAWFDMARAQRAMAFFPEALRHVEGDAHGLPFVLERWQRALIANLFGWVRRDRLGRVVRRYRKMLLYVPRKNGKTPLAAGIGLYMLFCDPERGQQGYIAAANREQAGFLFRHAKGMVEAQPALSRAATIFGGHAPVAQSRSIVRNADGSFLRVISADGETKHGGNLSLGIIDELHAQPNRALVDVLTTSMASAVRPQPLLVFITTADYDRPSICNETYDYAVKVRDGVLDDPTFLPVIYEAPRDADWTSPRVWRAANPNFGVTVSEDYLRAECLHAQQEPAFENEFKRLHLNLRTEQAERLIPMDQWDAAAAADWLDEFEGLPCWAGLDLSTVDDLSALALCWRRGDCYWIAAWHWAPRAKAEARQHGDGRSRRAPYLEWSRAGWLELTDGASIDYRFIRARINELARRFDVQLIAFDPYNARHLATELRDEDGLNLAEFRQGSLSMNEPVKMLLRCLASGKLRHDGNPLLRWQASNLCCKRDPAGNLKPDKARSADKIDGMVASIMALAGAALTPEQEPEVHLL